MIKYGVLLILSVQELTDCSKSWGNNGCIGGSMQNGIKINKKIELNL
jgi:hypothetical protein